MANIELSSGNEELNIIPDVIFVDNRWAKGSPEVLKSGVELAMKMGFGVLHIPDLLDSEIDTIDKYRKNKTISVEDVAVEDKVRYILRRHFGRNTESLKAYFGIIDLGIRLSGTKDESLQGLGLFGKRKTSKIKELSKEKIMELTQGGKRVIVFAGSVYNDYFEEELGENLDFHRFEAPLRD